MTDDTRLILVSGPKIERLRRIENQIRGFIDREDASPHALFEAEDDAEVLRSLADSYEDGVDPQSIPRRGHYADMEVCVAILRSDPRQRASGYDASPRLMADALESIIHEFGPAPGHSGEKR